MIRTIETLDGLDQLRDSWNELLSSSRARSVFLTHEWLSTWCRHLGGSRTLSILAAYEDDLLIGILPLVLRPPDLARMTPSTLEFVGSGVIGSDYLDAIIRDGWQTQALTEFGDYLVEAGYLLDLSQLRLGQSEAETLAQSLIVHEWAASTTAINVCPYIDLTGRNWESYCATLSSSQRYNFSRRLRNLSKRSGFRVECARTVQEAGPGIEILISLHQKRWDSREDASEAFHSEAVRQFHRDFVELAAERGWLRLHVMWLEGQPVAALYGLRFGGTFSFYQSGFDPAFGKESVGLVMMGLAIKGAVDEGCSEYDFLHGGEEYKFHWTRETRPLGRLELFPGVARARFYRRAIDLNRTARRMAKRVLQRP